MPEFPKHTLKDFRRLLKDCWDREPHNRPSIHAVLERLETFVKSGKATALIGAGDA